MLSASSDNEPRLVPLLKSILDSERRVALSIGDAIYQSDVLGTTKAIGAMFATCNDLPKVP